MSWPWCSMHVATTKNELQTQKEERGGTQEFSQSKSLMHSIYHLHSRTLAVPHHTVLTEATSLLLVCVPKYKYVWSIIIIVASHDLIMNSRALVHQLQQLRTDTLVHSTLQLLLYKHTPHRLTISLHTYVHCICETTSKHWQLDYHTAGLLELSNLHVIYVTLKLVSKCFVIRSLLKRDTS